MTPQRIVVVGPTGSGKSTLARALRRRLGLPHIELDALHWDSNWTEAPTEVFRERVARALAGDRWVVDGNYSAARDLIWPRADTLVWLDYALLPILWQLSRRTLGRIVQREPLWSDNRETFRTQFLSRDSLFIWLLKSYRPVRERYLRLTAQPEYAQFRVVRLRSPREMRAWLATIAER
jgi:adenylate kinase family enzyme